MNGTEAVTVYRVVAGYASRDCRHEEDVESAAGYRDSVRTKEEKGS